MDETLDYLPNGPAPRNIPRGKVLVHNDMYHGSPPGHEVGVGGFRAWWTDKANLKGLKRCNCGWRPDIGTHYKVRYR